MENFFSPNKQKNQKSTRPKAPKKEELKEELRILHSQRPTPLATNILPIDPALLEYQNLCSEIGYVPERFDKYDSSVLNFFAENDIPLYNIQEVSEFMNQILKIERRIRKTSLYWYWAKLTKNDVSFSEKFYSTVIELPYTKEIPFYILKRVAKLNQHFNKEKREMTFQVTDYFVPDPDPFIMATYRKKHYVFGVWDEPGMFLPEAK